MPPRRSQRSTKAGPSRAAKAQQDGSVPALYRDMLSEVAGASSSPTQTDEEGRSVKKRRVRGRVVQSGEKGKNGKHEEEADMTRESGQGASPGAASASTVPDVEEIDGLGRRQQTAYKDDEDSSEDDEDEDEDMDWEEVDLKQDVQSSHQREVDDQGDEKPLDIRLDDDESSRRARARAPPRRKPATALEKKMRLEVHRMHLLCLLGHLYIRNHWCNDEEVQNNLKPILNKRVRACFHEPETSSQYQRSHAFLTGLEQASQAWRVHWETTKRGMKRPFWADEGREVEEVCMSRSTFKGQT